MAQDKIQEITRMPEGQQLLADVCHIIDEARQNVAQSVNSALTMMYWHIGNAINNFTLDGQRAAYGQQILSALSTQLTEQYGKDFSERNLHRMVQFSRLFADYEIVSALSTKLPWRPVVPCVYPMLNVSSGMSGKRLGKTLWKRL